MRAWEEWAWERRSGRGSPRQRPLGRRAWAATLPHEDSGVGRPARPPGPRLAHCVGGPFPRVGCRPGGRGQAPAPARRGPQAARAGLSGRRVRPQRPRVQRPRPLGLIQSPGWRGAGLGRRTVALQTRLTWVSPLPRGWWVRSARLSCSEPARSCGWRDKRTPGSVPGRLEAGRGIPGETSQPSLPGLPSPRCPPSRSSRVESRK